MAKKLIRTYTFTPAAKQVSFTGYVNPSNLILITNTTTNAIIYNFTDNTLGGTTSYNATTNTTTVTLTFNTATAGMNTTDSLMIYVDDLFNTTRFDETFTDPTDKARVVSPQALIDTDFEYGAQISKWENLAMTNNRPFAYAVPTQIPGITAMTMNSGSRIVTVALGTTGSAPVNGTPITVQDTYLTIANGTYLIESGSGTPNFTYTARGTNTTSISSIFDTNKTNVFRGTTYSSASIGGAPTSMTYTGSLISVQTSVPHGLFIGNEIAVTGSTASSNAPNGSFVVATVTSPTTFTYYTPNIPTGTLSGTAALIYTRPQAQFLHRPFDGGVLFTSNGSSNYETAIRQTRRYFRYQSGKGIQMSSGTILKPNLQIDSLTSSGTTVYVQTKEQHNIQPGTTIQVLGVNESAYNGTFVVSNVTGYNTFTYQALSTPSVTTASGTFYVSIIGWYGAVNRLGIFEQQNGAFFEFDGQNIYAVRRNSTFQISGKVTATNGSNTITQTNSSFPTIFSKQLNIGDYIVLRGQSYRVQDIASDASMTIMPSYRGTTSQYVVCSKTIDTKIPQYQWNLDKMDGTGASGYSMDLSKMQMFYVDYTWYGAGAIRWGLRGQDGKITYVHRMQNNNVNTEAYMRSGNLPARYESLTVPPVTQLSASLQSTDISMSVNTTIGFPSTGSLLIRNGSAYEYVNYSGTGSSTPATFLNLTRGQSGSAALAVTIAQGANTGSVSSSINLQVGQRIISSSAFPDGTFISAINGTTLTFSQATQVTNPTVIAAPMANTATTFNYAATSPTSVELAYPTFAPSISHWGTSVIMDGRFDDDKSLLFTYGQTQLSNLPTGSTVALFSIRISPSVDNGIAAAFGARDLTNRMQLVLRTLDISLNYTSSIAPNILIKANLNGQPSGSAPVLWTNAVGNVAGAVNSSLANIADYSTQNVQVIGGENTGGFFTSGTGTNDLSLLRDLGNSILGGGGATSNVNIYPDGPDVLTITATNVGTVGCSVLGRLAWTEAQA
jgi:hypothetical protein